jgi:hypothetical protein
MIRKVVIYIFLVCFAFSYAQLKAQEGYPTPAKTDNLLFYIQRSHNKNTIAYELNFSDDKKINPEQPIHPYWIRYEEGGAKQELSYIQRNYAYGLKFQLIDKQNESYKIYFVSYSKKYILLMKSPKDNKFRAYISLNNKSIEIQKIFIKTDGGTFWFPVVKYIDVSGKDSKTGNVITERIVL